MNVDVYSDVVCPWCYVGERRLARALEALGPDADVTVTFRPYQLDPSAPSPGIPLNEYLDRRYGALAPRMREQVGMAASGQGLPIDWDAAIAVNTFDAHRLLQLAGEVAPERQRALAEALFSAHFARGLDVGDHDVLVKLAGESGLDPALARRHLESGAGAEELRTALDEARQLGIRAVPSFVLDGKYLVEGAQPVEALEQVFRQVLDEAA